MIDKNNISSTELSYYIRKKIIPDIKMFEEDVKSIKRKTLVKSISTASIGALFASLGFYEGAFSPVLFNALQQIGLLGLAVEGIHICTEHLQSFKHLQDKSSYFLWSTKNANLERLQKQNKKSKRLIPGYLRK